MNNNTKIVSAALAGILIGGITVVGANQAIQAIQNTNIKVSINGIVQEFKDATTGETQYPITYNDRTYLPLRNVAEILGANVDYDSSTKTASITSNNSNVYSNAELLVQEKIRYKLEKELEEKNPNFYNNNYFDLVARADINNDNQFEYILLIAHNTDSFNMRVFNSDGDEIVDGLDAIEYPVDSLEVRKDGDKFLLLVETRFGDGLCYENDTFYEVKLVDGKFEVKTIGKFLCDQEEEERKRSAIVHEDGSPATLDEAAAAHTLRYIIDNNVVSKEEFDKTIKEYKSEHMLINKIK